MKFKYLIPMITWVIPTILISLIMFKVDAPLTQAQNVGFVALLISACVTYIVGIQLAIKDKSK